MSKRTSVVNRSLRAVMMLALAAGSVRTIAGCKKDEPTATDSRSTTQPIRSVRVVQPAWGEQKRSGDEIVVAGHFFRIGTRVVTWMDPGGYDAYRTERRFAKFENADYEATVYNDLTKAAAATQKATRERTTRPTSFPSTGPATRGVLDSPNRYGLRYGDDSAAYLRNVATRPALANEPNWASPTTRPLTADQLEMVRGGGWPLELLQQKVDQFVIHYDVAGTSRQCFNVLQDDRNLSVQFMLDLDGTIYQTLDAKERAWQATKANSRSIGIEIANMGAYGAGDGTPPFATWYKKDANGLTYITIPPRLGGMDSQYTKPSMLRPIRNDLIEGTIGKLQKNGTFKPFRSRQYDLTPQQYEALSKLIAALCEAFPLIKCDYPRDADGKPLMRTMTNEEYNRYQGILGHYHVQTEKTDPGPAFQWELAVGKARQILQEHRSAKLAAK